MVLKLPIICHPAPEGGESGLCHTCYSYFWANKRRGVTNERMLYLQSIVDGNPERKRQAKLARLDEIRRHGIVCNCCGGDPQPVDAFTFDRARSSWYTTCKKCRTKASKAWGEKHPEAVRRISRTSNHKNAVKRRGITTEIYAQMLEQQGGVCAICRQVETKRRKDTGALFNLAIDHDHRSGAVRALLCTRCNALIGMAKDRIRVLNSAITYLHREPA